MDKVYWRNMKTFIAKIFVLIPLLTAACGRSADTVRYDSRSGRASASNKYGSVYRSADGKYDYSVKAQTSRTNAASRLVDTRVPEAAVHSSGQTYKSKKSNYSGYYKVGTPYTVLGKTYYPHENPNYREVGMASWYGEDFYGKKTANGEIYDMHDMTAAHPTLPLPCVVKVTNLENGRSVKLRVNDRGPFTKNRILDVSKAAAHELGFHNQGTTKVRVEYLQAETSQMLREFGLR